MNAQPLFDQLGQIQAYACGHCKTVRASGDHAGLWDEGDVKRSKLEAEACCRCEICKNALPVEGWHFGSHDYCVVIREAEKTRKAIEEDKALKAAEEESYDLTSWSQAEKHHSAKWRFMLADGREGTLYVGDDHGGTFSAAWARLDPSKEDLNPPAEAVRLQRSEEGTAMDAMAAIRRRYGTHVAWLLKAW